MPRYQLLMKGVAFVEGKLVVEAASVAAAEQKAVRLADIVNWKAASIPGTQSIEFEVVKELPNG